MDVVSQQVIYPREMTSTTCYLVLLPIVPHQPKDEQLGVVIPSDLAKPDRRAVELELTKERPMRRQRMSGTGNEINPGLIWVLDCPPFELLAKNNPYPIPP